MSYPPDVLAQIGRASHSDALLLHFPRMNFPSVPPGEHTTLEAEHLDSLADGYWELDPWVPINERDHAALTDQPRRAREVSPHNELVARPFHNQWIRPAGLLDSFAAKLSDRVGNDVALLSGLRRADRGDSRTDDLSVLAALLPHMRQVPAIDCQLQTGSSEIRNLRNVIDDFAPSRCGARSAPLAST